MLADFLHSYWMYCLVTVCLLPSLWISLFTLAQHLLHYTTHRLQCYVVRILVFVPIYGVITFMLLCIQSAANVLEMLRNIWEGLLIHSFLCLMMEYCGGETACGAAISRDPAVIKHAWPVNKMRFCGLNEDIPLNVGFVKRCRLGTMQYAFVRPLLAIFSLCLQPFGLADSAIFSIVYTLIVNFSVYLALYVLGLFYLAIRKLPGLARANCIAKFFALKMCVVFTFYQTYAIIWFSALPYETAQLFGTFLVLVELPLFAILQRVAYDIGEFKNAKPIEIDLGTLPTEEKPAPPIASKTSFWGHVMGYDRDDLNLATTPEGLLSMLTNAKSALDISDMFRDLYYSCSERYRQHSQLLAYESAPQEVDNEAPESTPKANFAEFEKAQAAMTQDERAKPLSRLEFL
ncbi:Organic solute transporter subunit alpha-Transmembrane protein 184 [Babesia duncani]|uniref:Organic solute transporter subunit alpha-Transmembrane protein 184 n=1 Tax=Babesia duncani TaxID=323732 RepID=A0AAD9PJ30_9APIC|nr:Organic solute transporter subunit alpha-Transmembrane protein 184 [Babesia duncani]